MFDPHFLNTYIIWSIIGLPSIELFCQTFVNVSILYQSSNNYNWIFLNFNLLFLLAISLLMLVNLLQFIFTYYWYKINFLFKDLFLLFQIIRIFHKIKWTRNIKFRNFSVSFFLFNIALPRSPSERIPQFVVITNITRLFTRFTYLL